MNRKILYALLASIVVSSSCLVAVAANIVTMQWTKYFWVRQPQLPIECEIEIGEPKIIGCPIDINVTLKVKDEVNSISGNLTIDLYWFNWTYNDWRGWYKWSIDKWQYVDTLLEETNVTITQTGQTWTCKYTPEWIGLYKVVATFSSETGTFTAEGY
ncbi:MAG: hypothetical protein QW270_05170 [Candidatus Bathyarchaeia archaeon]